MKKKLLSILLLLASCGSPKQEEVLIHDINVDFPTADTIVMTHKQSFESLAPSFNFIVKDTVLFALRENNLNVGYCYNINNGALITPIINNGKAANEVITGDGSLIITTHRDSIQFINLVLREIKSIALDDIITKPMGERVLSKIKVPQEIGSLDYKKVDNNIVIGYNYENDKDAKYFIFDGNELSLFGECNKKIIAVEQKLTARFVYSQFSPMFANCGSKIISADERGITLELIDVNTKSMIKDRFYTKFTYGKPGSTNPLDKPINLYTERVYCTDKEIYCVVRELDRTKPVEKNGHYSNLFILVFDWELNPVKKYYIGSFLNSTYSVYMTDDCKKFYYLTIGDEKQELFEGIIN